MRRRKRLSKRVSRKNFARVAKKVSAKNIRKTLHRGGYSL